MQVIKFLMNKYKLWIEIKSASKTNFLSYKQRKKNLNQFDSQTDNYQLPKNSDLINFSKKNIALTVHKSK